MNAISAQNAIYATIAGLHIYPVKSCAGIALEQATLSQTGLENDRRWMIVDERMRFITQREQPRLALIKPSLFNGGLQLDAPNLPSLYIEPVKPTATAMEVTVWRDQCNAFDEGDAAGEWLSHFLQKPVRLVCFDDSRPRASSRDWTGEVEALNRFSDGYPMLVISRASLADLNSRLAAPLPMNRFRPNIVIDGVPAYGEDSVHELADGGLRLRVVKPCTRCKITTTDQATGTVMGTEPLATLMKYRRSVELRGVMFGQNVISVAGVGSTLKVGQRLAVSWREQGRD